MAELLALAEAQSRVLERVQPLEGERVPVAQAAGRVLAEDAHSLVDLPPFASSAMDGFAIRAADTPGRLPVVARIRPPFRSRPASIPAGVGWYVTGDWHWILEARRGEIGSGL